MLNDNHNSARAESEMCGDLPRKKKIRKSFGKDMALDINNVVNIAAIRMGDFSRIVFNKIVIHIHISAA